ncbi:uncharacterized protein N7498_003451 [Penicillium cinerascens]|uniref:Uncharacterized protein n=1 Tax=Penicillium cinerascens TaxID=70096 RepID=A0A9W9T7X0_9EURO|nr:uncharacterized protein N7498_003451 [Penicillium cinerascens]KAJ5211805.1 hypothetical protein N7498_003451 [Penicillium cinerascens]
MSLDSVTSGLGKGLPVNQVTDKATGSVKTLANDPVQGVSDTTKTVTDPIIPGEFPADDAAEKKYDGAQQPEVNFTALWASFSQWCAGLFPQAVDMFEYFVQWVVNRYFPPPKQAAMYEAMLNRPIASTFLVCQAICCGVPLLVFLVGVVVFAIVSVILWALLSLLILGPILLVASMMGISLWGWGWILYGLVKWVDQMFLGGMITRFWLPQGQEKEQGEGQGEDDDSAPENDESVAENEKKDS